MATVFLVCVQLNTPTIEEYPIFAAVSIDCVTIAARLQMPSNVQQLLQAEDAPIISDSKSGHNAPNPAAEYAVPRINGPKKLRKKLPYRIRWYRFSQVCALLEPAINFLQRFKNCYWKKNPSSNKQGKKWFLLETPICVTSAFHLLWCHQLVQLLIYDARSQSKQESLRMIGAFSKPEVGQLIDKERNAAELNRGKKLIASTFECCEHAMRRTCTITSLRKRMFVDFYPQQFQSSVLHSPRQRAKIT